MQIANKCQQCLFVCLCRTSKLVPPSRALKSLRPDLKSPSFSLITSNTNSLAACRRKRRGGKQMSESVSDVCFECVQLFT